MGSSKDNDDKLTAEADQTSLSFQSITEGFTSRDIPKVKFIEDIDAFSKSFDPPASAELMIGAFSDFFAKLKGVEGTLAQRGKIRMFCEKSRLANVCRLWRRIPCLNF